MTPRIIGDTSPLNRLSVSLHPLQRGWLEGLRYSIDIADLAMRRLGVVLYALSGRATSDGSIQQTPLEPDAYTAAMMDSWTFIDAAWRLKRFLLDSRIPQPPGPPQPKPDPATTKVDLDGFRAALDGVGKLRDGFQHLDDRAARLANEGETVWGYLNWIVIYPEDSRAQTCLLVPGSCGPGTTTYNLVNPAGKAFTTIVDHVVLNAFGRSVNLSELHRQISRATRNFEDVISPQFEGQSHGASTFLVSLTAILGVTLTNNSVPPALDDPSPKKVEEK